MNLNENPTVDQLKTLFAAADDEAGHHILWANKAGDVHLTCLSRDEGPVGFEMGAPSLLLRYGTFSAGSGHVGVGAATDDNFMASLYKSLVREWAKTPTKRRYIDEF